MSAPLRPRPLRDQRFCSFTGCGAHKEDIERDHLETEEDQVLHQNGDDQMHCNPGGNPEGARAPNREQDRRTQFECKRKQARDNPEERRHVVHEPTRDIRSIETDRVSVEYVRPMKPVTVNDLAQACGPVLDQQRGL